MNNTQGPVWEVFTQKKSGAPFQHAGSLHAFDKEMALENARDLYTRRDRPSGLWVVPASEIVAVSPGDEAPFFDPSDDKVYRHPTFYEVPEGVQNLLIMDTQQVLFQYCLRLGDSNLMLGHRLSEMCSRGPMLEEDIALTKFALDHIGQAEALLQYAGEVEDTQLVSQFGATACKSL